MLARQSLRPLAKAQGRETQCTQPSKKSEDQESTTREGARDNVQEPDGPKHSVDTAPTSSFRPINAPQQASNNAGRPPDHAEVYEAAANRPPSNPPQNAPNSAPPKDEGPLTLPYIMNNADASPKHHSYAPAPSHPEPEVPSPAAPADRDYTPRYTLPLPTVEVMHDPGISTTQEALGRLNHYSVINLALGSI